MASEIRPPHQFANFRPSISERAKKKPSAQERREGNSAAHLAFLRELPCIVTGKVPAGEVHHLKGSVARKERGVGMRATDKFGVPLSRIPHDELERIGSRHEWEWFEARGIADPYTLALALWAASGDIDKGFKIVNAHRDAKR